MRRNDIILRAPRDYSARAIVDWAAECPPVEDVLNAQGPQAAITATLIKMVGALAAEIETLRGAS